MRTLPDGCSLWWLNSVSASLQCAQQPHAALIVETAFAGHLHLASGADQQAHAQPLFQPFQRVADRGARQLQAFGRPAEAAQFDDAGKMRMA